MGVKANKRPSIVYICRPPNIYELYEYFIDEKRKWSKKTKIKNKINDYLSWEEPKKSELR